MGARTSHPEGSRLRTVRFVLCCPAPGGLCKGPEGGRLRSRDRSRVAPGELMMMAMARPRSFVISICVVAVCAAVVCACLNVFFVFCN